MKVTVSENSVLHSGKTYIKGETINCSDDEGQWLVSAGAAFIAKEVASVQTDPIPAETEDAPAENKTGGSKKGK